MSDRTLSAAAGVVEPMAYPPASVGRTWAAIKYTFAIATGLLLGLIGGAIVAISNGWMMLC